jgi:hypothetical protein
VYVNSEAFKKFELSMNGVRKEIKIRNNFDSKKYNGLEEQTRRKRKNKKKEML